MEELENELINLVAELENRVQGLGEDPPIEDGILILAVAKNVRDKLNEYIGSIADIPDADKIHLADQLIMFNKYIRLMDEMMSEEQI